MLFIEALEYNQRCFLKRLYLEAKWKKHSRSVQNKVLKQRSKRFKKAGYFASISDYRNRPNLSLIDNTARIQVPSNFSIINNPSEMLECFTLIHNCIKSGKDIYLDVCNVESLTFDAILYTLSRIDYYRRIHPHLTFRGNTPSDSYCKKLFVDSGFFKFVTSDKPVVHVNSDIYTIQSGSNVNPTVAQDIINFAKSHLKNGKISNSSGLYATLIECMANSHEHAYVSEVTTLTSKWWLMASYNSDKDNVRFSFLDNGFGIPNTLRKNYIENIRQFLPLFENLDSQLVVSSLNGEFRTKTGLRNRGKGLPRIYRSVKYNQIRDLVIMSRKAHVLCDIDALKSIEMNHNFQGTLLTWTFS